MKSSNFTSFARDFFLFAIFTFTVIVTFSDDVLTLVDVGSALGSLNRELKAAVTR